MGLNRDPAREEQITLALTKARLLAVLALALATSCAVVYQAVAQGGNRGGAQGDPGGAPPAEEAYHGGGYHDHGVPPGHAVGEMSYAFDVTDERQLVGDADNVFIGRVLEKVGEEGAPVSGPGGVVFPQTQFAVQVQENIKGDLAGVVTVTQAGGRAREGGDVVLFEGDPLLEHGQEVLLVTKYDQANGWHTVTTPGFADLRIKDKEQKKALKEKFEKAKKEQVDPRKVRS